MPGLSGPRIQTSIVLRATIFLSRTNDGIRRQQCSVSILWRYWNSRDKSGAKLGLDDSPHETRWQTTMTDQSAAEAVERDARVRQHMAYRFARANVTYKMEGEPSAKDLDDFFNTSIGILVERLCSHPGFMREDYSGTDIRKWLDAQRATT